MFALLRAGAAEQHPPSRYQPQIVTGKERRGVYVSFTLKREVWGQQAGLAVGCLWVRCGEEEEEGEDGAPASAHPQGMEVMERSELQPPVTNGDRRRLAFGNKTLLPITSLMNRARRTFFWGGGGGVGIVLPSVAMGNSALDQAGTRDAVIAVTAGSPSPCPFAKGQGGTGPKFLPLPRWKK